MATKTEISKSLEAEHQEVEEHHEAAVERARNELEDLTRAYAAEDGIDPDEPLPDAPSEVDTARFLLGQTILSECSNMTVSPSRGAAHPPQAKKAVSIGSLVQQENGEPRIGFPVNAAYAESQPERRRLAMTCQAGVWWHSLGARHIFQPEDTEFPRTLFSTSQRAEASLAATIPANEIGDATSGYLRVTFSTPDYSREASLVTYDVWRLAIPSDDDYRENADCWRFAMAGLRGTASLAVMGTGHGTVVRSLEFLNKSLVSRGPERSLGYGLRWRHPHVLQFPIPRIRPGNDLRVRLKVSLLGFLANYNPLCLKPGASFYAGVDFGGGGGQSYDIGLGDSAGRANSRGPGGLTKELFNKARFPFGPMGVASLTPVGPNSAIQVSGFSFTGCRNAEFGL